jgi:hypothetical protein
MSHPGMIDVSFVAMAGDATAAGDAVLRRDLDEARFRTHQVAVKAKAMGLSTLFAAARVAHADLGPMGGAPRPSYGASLLHLAAELDALCSSA